jgi:hypothetical protein
LAHGSGKVVSRIQAPPPGNIPVTHLSSDRYTEHFEGSCNIFASSKQTLL